MEENNRKGPGVFYAVVGVATLVVAIIGATFAFFSASDTDATITGNTAAAGGIELLVTPETVGTGVDMVPLNIIANQTKELDAEGKETGKFVDATPQLEPALKNSCVDANNNNVCQVYKIVVTNKSTTSTVSVRGNLTLANIESTSSQNLYWKLLDADYASGEAPGYSTDVKQGIKGNITVGGNSIAEVNGEVGQGSEISSHVLIKNASETYYVMVWLEETGDKQETIDAAAKFVGTVFFSAVDASGAETGITASFSS